MLGSPRTVLAKLQEAARRDLGDFMTFEIGPDADHPEIQGDGMKYDGLRFRAEGKLAGKVYGQPFGVDVGFGDPIIGEPDLVVAEDTLAFAGIPPPTLRLYPIETHLAEKIHAYTMPRKRPNSRVKDLPDIALLATIQALEAKQVRAALEQTFAFRKTHAFRRSSPIRSPRGKHRMRRWRGKLGSPGHTRRCHRSGACVSRPCARREARSDLGSEAVELARLSSRRSPLGQTRVGFSASSNSRASLMQIQSLHSGHARERLCSRGREAIGLTCAPGPRFLHGLREVLLPIGER